jgi:hypothetical protein
MEDRTREGQVKRIARHPVLERFDRIDPHRSDQHVPAPNSPGGFPEGKSKK